MSSRNHNSSPDGARGAPLPSNRSSGYYAAQSPGSLGSAGQRLLSSSSCGSASTSSGRTSQTSPGYIGSEGRRLISTSSTSNSSPNSTSGTFLQNLTTFGTAGRRLLGNSSDASSSSSSDRNIPPNTGMGRFSRNKRREQALRNLMRSKKSARGNSRSPLPSELSSALTSGCYKPLTEDEIYFPEDVPSASAARDIPPQPPIRDEQIEGHPNLGVWATVPYSDLLNALYLPALVDDDTRPLLSSGTSSSDDGRWRDEWRARGLHARITSNAPGSSSDQDHTHSEDDALEEWITESEKTTSSSSSARSAHTGIARRAWFTNRQPTRRRLKFRRELRPRRQLKPRRNTNWVYPGLVNSTRNPTKSPTRPVGEKLAHEYESRLTRRYKTEFSPNKYEELRNCQPCENMFFERSRNTEQYFQFPQLEDPNLDIHEWRRNKAKFVARKKIGALNSRPENMKH